MDMSDSKSKSDRPKDEKKGAGPSSGLSAAQKQNTGKALQNAGVRSDCPMCGKNQWVLADGYFNHHIQNQVTGGLVLGGPIIPAAAIICGNCGFISQHALGALGLLPKSEEE